MPKVKVLRKFQDLKENKARKVNETFEATEKRIKEINSTKYGDLVEAVKEEEKRKSTKKVGD